MEEAQLKSICTKRLWRKHGCLSCTGWINSMPSIIFKIHFNIILVSEIWYLKWLNRNGEGCSGGIVEHGCLLRINLTVKQARTLYALRYKTYRPVSRTNRRTSCRPYCVTVPCILQSANAVSQASAVLCGVFKQILFPVTSIARALQPTFSLGLCGECLCRLFLNLFRQLAGLPSQGLPLPTRNNET